MPVSGPARRSRSPARPRNGSTPTVLLVHGAFTDASSWSAVIGELLAAGLDVVAPASPLRGLVSDARYIACGADEIESHAIAGSRPALIAEQIRTAAVAIRRPTVTSNP